MDCQGLWFPMTKGTDRLSVRTGFSPEIRVWLRGKNTVSVVHEENSSFPSANPTIDAIKTGASGESVQVRLSDSSSFFVPPEILIDLGLSRGQEVGEELRGQLEGAAEVFGAQKKVLELAARREHSQYELRRKLRKRGFSESSITKVIEKMVRLNIIDDERFAESWLRTRLDRKAEGFLKLKAGLQHRGVHGDLADRVLKKYLTGKVGQRNLEKATEKALLNCGGDEKKFVRRLKNRGFSWNEIKNYSIDNFF